MRRDAWDIYLKERLVALIDETGAKLLSFDGVVPYPGVIAAKNGAARNQISLGETWSVAEKTAKVCIRPAIKDDGHHHRTWGFCPQL